MIQSNKRRQTAHCPPVNDRKRQTTTCHSGIVFHLHKRSRATRDDLFSFKNDSYVVRIEMCVRCHSWRWRLLCIYFCLFFFSFACFWLPASGEIKMRIQYGTVCRQHCVTAACHWTSLSGGWRLIILLGRLPDISYPNLFVPRRYYYYCLLYTSPSPRD